VLTFNLPGRTIATFHLVYCSVTLVCSSSLPCGEEMATRFPWNF